MNAHIPDENSEGSAIKAAAYVRMSTEHQQYSTSNQMDVIREYAARRSIQIVKIYSDEGKSGLNIQGRNSLAQMIADVQGGSIEFACILVYDVSRWGRFQDADESAYYEYICRRSGISVNYCAEQFENDGSPVSTIVKGVKRAMAGEYSRELSSKVFQGACRLIQLGYKQGGMAGYGLRRMLVDQNQQPKGVLRIGEQKSLQTDRVILAPGPDEEVANVRWMYDQFVHHGKSELWIAQELNARGVKTDLARNWTRSTVHQILTNEKYVGNNVYHRTSFKLKRKHIQNPPEKWVRAEGAWEAIVDPDIFYMAQGIIVNRSRRFSDDEMLEKLRSILKKHGRVSGILIDEEDDSPSSGAFRHRFGSLITAYRLIGYNPPTDFEFIEINHRLRQMFPDIVESVVRDLLARDAVGVRDEETDLILLNGELRVSITLSRHRMTSAGASRWLIRLDESLRPDITIAVRMDSSNTKIRDYYLLPSIDLTFENLHIAEDNGIHLDAYRFDSLDHFFQMAERAKLEEAA